ncbi:hypothetical protein L873DRAFT_1386887 [Choiromyces venosus 120613-1]|uniref:Uncharacterized protein n=1 Tax=Choiromyces venosus 120613-1 TaxID=1336337 RepID=A0A3N4JLT5_9PEZI|nr:hypothetical protein L873DRAFT_1386887 [Choiromyces venosus 120613-1]
MGLGGSETGRILGFSIVFIACLVIAFLLSLFLLEGYHCSMYWAGTHHDFQRSKTRTPFCIVCNFMRIAHLYIPWSELVNFPFCIIFFDFSIVYCFFLLHFLVLAFWGDTLDGWSFVRLFVLSHVYYRFLFEVLLGCLATGTSEFELEGATGTEGQLGHRCMGWMGNRCICSGRGVQSFCSSSPMG